MNSAVLNSKIFLPNGLNRIHHSKASEEYLDVEFNYNEGKKWVGRIPVEYRRTGTHLLDSEVNCYLNSIYDELNPDNYEQWLKDQYLFWENKKAEITKSFFDALVKGKGGWKCAKCDLPANQNFARRIQDLKEFGYTIATDTNKFCKRCQCNKTHSLLVPLKRKGSEGNGYEHISPKLKSRILNVLNNIDVYENKPNKHLLPDHKFSEIRWDDKVKSSNLDDMTDIEIKNKFQLLSNQRNQQKREVCRKCVQSDKRGTIFGIPFFYKGNIDWDKKIPKRGKEAEEGCKGCPWYDIERWRGELINKINKITHA